MTQAQLARFLTELGYQNLCYIQGQLCGTTQYVLTATLAVGLSEKYVYRRYCYPDSADAYKALVLYTDINQHPSGNWMKVKGFMNDQFIEEFNPEWLNSP